MKGKTFWLRVNQLLKKNKTTQKELADFIGISRRTLETWFYRGTIPYIHEGYLIAKFLNVSVYYLITGKEEKNQKEINDIRELLLRANKKLGKL